MSGLAGIYLLDGAPAHPQDLERMLALITHCGPDGAGRWFGGSIALGHQMLAATPESLLERQPLRDPTGQLVLVLDGRVDNRDDLCRALLAAGADPRVDTDAELVLQSYRAWGEACPARILGDFAFAIWDARRQSLFCARDYIGVRPFYYHFDGRRFLFGTLLRQILAFPGVPLAPNEGMIGECLCDRLTSRSETLYAAVMRLPPAHILTISPAGLKIAPYWDLDLAREIHYKTNTEYADHFRSLFDEAVRCRLRSSRKAGAYLSGGLDSSSVVCTVHHLASTGQVRVQGFETFSLVFPTDSECDESPFIQEIAGCVKVPENRLPPSPLDFDLFSRQARRHLDLPDTPNGVLQYPLRSLACQKGFGVLLTGLGGDQWLADNPYHYASLLGAGRLAEIRRQARFDGLGTLDLAREALPPLLSPPVRTGLRRLLGRNGIPAYIRPEFAGRVSLADRLNPPVPATPTRPSGLARRGLWEVAVDGRLACSFEINARMEPGLPLEERHPFFDRRLVEFLVAIPEDQRRKGAWEKAVLRRAMRGRLPERVFFRRSKAQFLSILEAAVDQALRRRPLHDWCAGLLDYIDPGRLPPCDQAGPLPAGLLWPVWMVLSLALWSECSSLVMVE
ncbi:MAG TPA: asparagine synthase-related protein [Anaerolineaceae bacterium]|nr:asparagine synthase-related protein [Anaerolineaceae bacterium]